MVKESSQLAQYLSSVHPFGVVARDTLDALIPKIEIRGFKRGEAIIIQGGPPSKYLYIIKQGGVKVFIASDDSAEVVIDYRGEGESFGFMSIASGDKARAGVTALEDTTCLLISRADFISLLVTYPEFTEFYLKSIFSKFADKTYQEMKTRSLMCSGGDRLLFSTTVGELITRQPITARTDITIREAGLIMSRHQIGSLVLVDAAGSPVGMLTVRDLRDKVVAKGRDVDASVREVMSITLFRVDAGEYCFEALLKMIQYGIHHLLVVERGKLKGVITNHDLLMLQGTSPVSVARDIQSRHDVGELKGITDRINETVSILMRQGAKSSNITRIISELNDRLIMKLLDLGEKRFGPPPVPYAWIVLGSEGRCEQTFKTDQDNAIIYADPAEGERDEAARYFAQLAGFMRDSLVSCGVPECRAGFMASTPEWTQPVFVWRQYFTEWISTPTPEAVLKTLIFFDFRFVHGERALAASLRDHVNALIRSNRVYLGFLANTIIRNRPPLGFFGDFLVEKTGEHKDEFNLKVKAIAPIVDAVRLFGLEKGVSSTSTLERIRDLRGIHTVIDGSAEELEQALEFLLHMRMKNQLEQALRGEPIDDFVNPARLTNIERKSLKDAFRLISSTQDMIIELYKHFIL